MRVACGVGGRVSGGVPCGLRSGLGQRRSEPVAVAMPIAVAVTRRCGITGCGITGRGIAGGLPGPSSQPQHLALAWKVLTGPTH